MWAKKKILYSEYYYNVGRLDKRKKNFKDAIFSFKNALKYTTNEYHVKKIHVEIYACFVELDDMINANIFLQDIRCYYRKSKEKLPKSKTKTDIMVIGKSALKDLIVSKLNRFSNKTTSIYSFNHPDGPDKYIIKSETYENSRELLEAWINP